MVEGDQNLKKPPLMEMVNFTQKSFVEGLGSSNPLVEGFSQHSKVYPDEDMNGKPNELSDDEYEDMNGQPKPMNSGNDLGANFTTDKLFYTHAEMIKWCQFVGKWHNMVIVTTKSVNKPLNKGSIVELDCERHGVYKAWIRKVVPLAPGKNFINNVKCLLFLWCWKENLFKGYAFNDIYFRWE